MAWQAAHLHLFVIVLSLGYAASECTYVTTSPVSGSTIDTGFGTFELAPLTLGVDTPTLYTDFDTLVNYTSGIGWKIHRFHFAALERIQINKNVGGARPDWCQNSKN